MKLDCSGRTGALKAPACYRRIFLLVTVQGLAQLDRTDVEAQLQHRIRFRFSGAVAHAVDGLDEPELETQVWVKIARIAEGDADGFLLGVVDQIAHQIEYGVITEDIVGKYGFAHVGLV